MTLIEVIWVIRFIRTSKVVQVLASVLSVTRKKERRNGGKILCARKIPEYFSIAPSPCNLDNPSTSDIIK